jgi:hypothetical protein
MDLNYLCRIEPLSCWALDFPFAAAASSQASNCVQTFLGMCLVTPQQQSGGIFGFAEFVQGFALLVLIYTVSEVRYRFRVETAPLRLYSITIWLAAIIGLGTLLTDVWFAQQYPLPSFLTSRSIWQAVFGSLFLFLVLAWLWSVFVRPTVFGRLNRFNFTRTLYRYLLQGAESDLPAIAAELGRSASSIIKLSGANNGPANRSANTSRYANDILLLIAMRKFCRHIVASAPGTAISFFSAMSHSKKYHLPIGQFAANISTEALLNRDSLLYHEDEGFYSGYFGYVRPFTNAVYGDFHLVEALTKGNSPLDIALDVGWDSKKLEAYSRAVLTTFKSALNEGQFHNHSYALYRAFGTIERSCSDLYKLNETPTRPDFNDITDRLDVVVSFVNKAIDLLEKLGIQNTRLRRHDEPYKWRSDYYDHVVHLMFEIIKRASAVKTSDFVGWHIQHNTVWTGFFNFDESKTRKIILFKLRRLLYEEIRSMETLPHFANAPVLGLCLNVMSFQVGKKRDHTRDEYQLRKAVISWTRRNYLWVVERSPKAAAAVLTGSITFDAENKRLVKTYAEGLRAEPPKDYLGLDEPTKAVSPIDG